jgi:hypothetical protein
LLSDRQVTRLIEMGRERGMCCSALCSFLVYRGIAVMGRLKNIADYRGAVRVLLTREAEEV